MKPKKKPARKTATKSERGAARRKSTKKPKPVPVPKTLKAIARLKFAKLGGDEKLAARLVSAGFRSLPQLAMLPAGVLQRRVGDKLTKAEEKTLAMLHRNARRMATYSADRAIMLMQAQSVGGAWMIPDGSLIPELPEIPGLDIELPNFEDACHCGCCDSIFSLKAYLFDLLDLLYHYWSIDLFTVERLLLRSFSKITVYDPKLSTTERDLDCEALNAPLPQARIACEVMQGYLRALGKTEARAAWPRQFVDGLLRLILPQQVATALIEDDPGLASRDSRFTIAKVKAAPNLPPAFATAIDRWEAELNVLTLDLPGIDRATALLADNSLGMIGYEPDDKFAERRETTIRQWLVDYCDALRWSSDVNRDRLEVSLFISIDSGACRTTTRLQELVTSVQQIVESIRSGEIARLRRVDLSSDIQTLLREAETLPLAESAWIRLRDYETWLGYMYGWVYPENVLSPILVATDENEVPSHVSDVFQESIRPLLDRTESAEEIYIVISISDEYRSIQDAFEPLARQGDKSLIVWAALIEYHHEASKRTFESSAHGSDFERHLLYPLLVGPILNQNAEFASAHEWYRLLYDPATRRVADIFNNYTGDATNERSRTYWLDEPFDPVAIANRREGVWLRHTILAMARNLIDWADDEFARGLPDTFQRAGELYELARRALQAPLLQNPCEKMLLDVVNGVQDKLGYNSAIAHGMVSPLKEVSSADLMSKAGGDIRKALSGRGSVPEKRRAVKRIIARTVKADHRQRPHRSLAVENERQHTLANDMENAVFFQPAPETGSGGKRSEPFPKGGDPSVPDDPIFQPFDSAPSPSVWFFCIPPNPVMRSLQLHIDTQLRKLQLCLDFMGEPQLPRVYGCDTYDAATGLINRPTATLDQYNYCVDQPRYRYSFLIEKARQYVDVAQRFGSILLQALQNKDDEAFGQLRARHAIELADATIELRRLGRQEALDGVEIAQLQKDRAVSQVTFWSDRVGDPNDLWDDLSEEETQSLGQLTAALGSQRSVEAMTELVNSTSIVVGTLLTATGLGAVVGVPLLLSTTSGPASSASARAATESLESNLLSMKASFQRRGEEWKNQLELAEIDSRIADSQVTLADDRLRIAGQELEIASLQLSHAQEELRFLQDKTTNLALYDWMVRVLSRDYRSLMQIAACFARMAQRALEFERQETVRIITGDYWNIAQGALASNALTNEQRSLGLLGAERLLTDLTKLDAFKLVTEKRRLQISKTFSLARMMPIELVEFRDSGSITFNTLLEWFNDGFQGHYLRLIKSVRVSMFAIVPPLDGIHAMLHNTGESSVVVLENGSFVEKRAARNFGEDIALDSAFNESGLFVLNYEDPMLLPFEGLGVETQWTLELPRGNNRFNFKSIADVFLTIEYTAEYSRQLEQDMRNERVDQVVSEDTAVPLRLQFPDLWYHLKNHRKDDATDAFPVFQFTFYLPRAAFAPNLADPITVAHLTMLVSGDLNAAEQSVVVDGFRITSKGAVLHRGVVPRPPPPPAGIPGDSTSAFGHPVFGANSVMLSTRGNSAIGLPSHPQIGTATPDEWIVEFAPELFPTLIEKISDILLVVTVTGRRA